MRDDSEVVCLWFHVLPSASAYDDPVKREAHRTLLAADRLGRHSVPLVLVLVLVLVRGRAESR